MSHRFWSYFRSLSACVLVIASWGCDHQHRAPQATRAGAAAEPAQPAPTPPVSDNPALHAVKATPPHMKAAQAIRVAFLGQLPDKRREEVTETLEPTHVQLIEGHFPADHTPVVISVPLRDGQFANALFIVDHVGEVAQVLDKPAIEHKALRAVAMGDPDGDGIDGVLVEKPSSKRAWVDFVDGKAVEKAPPAAVHAK